MIEKRSYRYTACDSSRILENVTCRPRAGEGGGCGQNHVNKKKTVDSCNLLLLLSLAYSILEYTARLASVSSL